MLAALYRPTLQHCIVWTIPRNSPRFISPGYYHSLIFTHFILCISIDILYLKQNSEKGYGPEGQSVILVIGLWTILIYCGFVIHFGCLKTSPEKPDFSNLSIKLGIFQRKTNENRFGGTLFRASAWPVCSFRKPVGPGFARSMGGEPRKREPSTVKLFTADNPSRDATLGGGACNLDWPS